jgi:hypothetical protein
MKRIVTAVGGAVLLLACARGDARDVRVEETTASPAPAAPTGTSGRAAADESLRATDYKEITIPAGTILPVNLATPVGSDTSHVEQPVHATLRRAIVLHGVQVLPAGTAVNGHVTAARRPGRVKGRSYIAMRFTELDTPGEGTARISTATVGRLGRTTKKKDTIEILGPAAAGAVIGRVAGGKSGARKGAVIGGAGGTGYVLATRGEEVRLGRGANLSVRLTAPVTVRVPVKR